MFESDANFDRVRKTYGELVREIVQRAEGVLLWARLDLKMVIREVGLYSTHGRLRQKILGFPREMNDLYDKMLADLDDPDKATAYLMLYLVFMHDCYDPFNAIYFAWLDDMGQPSFPSEKDIGRMRSKEDFHENLATIERRLSGLTRGLLVIVQNDGSEPKSVLSYTIRFFHRTARDYLKVVSRRKHFEDAFPGLDMDDILVRLKIAEVSLASCSWSNVTAYQLQARFKSCPYFHDADHLTHRQVRLESMDLFKDHLASDIRAAFQVETLGVSQHRFTSPSEPASFVHYAAAQCEKFFMCREN